MKKILLFGAGKIAEEMYFYFTHDSDYEVAAFTVDKDFITTPELFSLPVLPFEEIEKKFPPSQYPIFVALGYQNLNRIRELKYFEAKNKGYQVISYVSSKASNFGNVPIGENCCILENNSIQPLSRIGNNVTLWCNNHIGHHSSIADNCFLAGHVVLAGNSHIGSNCFIGINTTIGHNLQIGDNNIIGAASLITKNTDKGAVFVSQDTGKFRLDSESFLKLTKL